jgi:hypothetical protein
MTEPNDTEPTTDSPADLISRARENSEQRTAALVAMIDAYDAAATHDVIVESAAAQRNLSDMLREAAQLLRAGAAVEQLRARARRHVTTEYPSAARFQHAAQQIVAELAALGIPEGHYASPATDRERAAFEERLAEPTEEARDDYDWIN